MKKFELKGMGSGVANKGAKKQRDLRNLDAIAVEFGRCSNKGVVVS